eukprot:symbB.v1.2.028522.t1/scaffold3032.1/size64972/2
MSSSAHKLDRIHRPRRICCSYQGELSWLYPYSVRCCRDMALMAANTAWPRCLRPSNPCLPKTAASWNSQRQSGKSCG